MVSILDNCNINITRPGMLKKQCHMTCIYKYGYECIQYLIGVDITVVFCALSVLLTTESESVI